MGVGSIGNARMGSRRPRRHLAHMRHVRLVTGAYELLQVHASFASLKGSGESLEEAIIGQHIASHYQPSSSPFMG